MSHAMGPKPLLSLRIRSGAGLKEGGRARSSSSSSSLRCCCILPSLLLLLLACLHPGEGNAMAEVPTVVRIKVALKIQPNDGPVYFKVDGQRFGQNRTIKLLTGAKYKVEVAIKPGTVQATTMGIGGVTVPLEQTSREAQLVTYTGIYDTEGVTHTKSGERQPIQVNIQVTDIGAFETVWQVKFYDYHKRDHCQWGNSFGCIEYECKPNETRSLMWINKETFF